MGLESGNYIADLVVTNPVGATDDRSTADDHLRLLKGVLKNCFTGFAGHILVMGTDSVGTDSYAINPTVACLAYATGMTVAFVAGTANTGAATLDVSSLGAKSLVKHYNDPLETGDIEAGQFVVAIYDGTNFQVTSPLGTLAVAHGGTSVSAIPSFQAYRTSTQNVAPGATDKIQYTSEGWDTNNNFDPTTNYRFTPTVPGKYLLIAGMWTSHSWTALDTAGLWIRKNGSNYAADTWKAPVTASLTLTLNISCIADANGTTDYFEVYLAVGGNTTVGYTSYSTSSGTSRFEGIRLG